MSRYKTLKGHTGISEDLEHGGYLATKSVNGKRYYKKTGSLREAKFWRKNFHPIISPSPKASNPLRKPGKGSNGNNKSITVSGVIDKYKELRLPSLGEAQQYKKMRVLEKFCDGLMDIPLCELTPEMIAHYLAQKKEVAIKTDPQRCSFDRDLKEFSSVLNYYIQVSDMSFQNPIRPFHKEIGKIREPKKISKKIPAEDFVSFLNAFTPKQELYRDLAIMQFYCASRVHETAGIQIGNIDLVNRVLLIKDTVSWPKRSEPKIKSSTKTGEERLVHINDSMLEIINKRLAMLPKRCTTLFNRNGKLLRYNAIQRNYNKALEAAGLPYTGTHILRYSMATTTRKLHGMDHAQSVTGHKSRKMLEHYADLDAINLNRESVTSVERFINRIKTGAKTATKCDRGECEIVEIGSGRG